MVSGVQGDLFGLHTRARSGDPDTSFKAAAQATPKMTERRRIVLRHFLQRQAMTDLELEGLCANHGSTYRTRRSELVQMGYIADSGERRLLHGSNRIVWAITAEGIKAARVLC
jgi:hypothetical protein